MILCKQIHMETNYKHIEINDEQVTKMYHMRVNEVHTNNNKYHLMK